MKIEIKTPEKDPLGTQILIDGKPTNYLQAYTIRQEVDSGFPSIVLEGVVIEGVDITIEESDKVTFVWTRMEDIRKINKLNQMIKDLADLVENLESPSLDHYSMIANQILHTRDAAEQVTNPG